MSRSFRHVCSHFALFTFLLPFPLLVVVHFLAFFVFEFLVFFILNIFENVENVQVQSML